MTRFLSLVFVFMFLISINAQHKDAYISFEELAHDLGTIKDNTGTFTFFFQFTNIGEQPLVINDIKSPCACIVPSYSKAPIMPGATSKIEIQFDPKGIKGSFSKNITIISNAANNSVMLYVIGAVEQPKGIEEIYRREMGGVRMTTNLMSFNKLYNTQTLTKSVEVINPTDSAIKVEIPIVPKHLTITIKPKIFLPGDTGRITVTYNASLKGAWGEQTDYLRVFVNEINDKTYKLAVSAEITEDFSTWTVEQRANSPIITFESITFNFDTIFQNSKVEHDFKFTNTGKSDLEIRNVKSSCGCTASNAGEKIVKPGQSSYIHASFSTDERSGLQNKSITVVTNDPENPTIVLKFSAIVVPVKLPVE